MSRGFGPIQRAIILAFEDQPERRFTVVELCALAYPEKVIAESHKDSVRRALRKVEDDIDLVRCRVGSQGIRGWKHVIGRRGST